MKTFPQALSKSGCKTEAISCLQALTHPLIPQETLSGNTAVWPTSGDYISQPPLQLIKEPQRDRKANGKEAKNEFHLHSMKEWAFSPLAHLHFQLPGGR